MENFNSSFNLIQLILKWKTHLGVIIIIAIILSAFFSGKQFITPKYKSIGVVYPHNINPYSEESETEQMLQFMQGSDIIDSMIEKYNLAEHYEINPDYKYYYSTMLYEFSQNVSINKTPFEAVEIKVLDKDPQIASDMVYSIVDFYNKKIRSIHNEKYLEVITLYEGIIRRKTTLIDSVQNRMQVLGNEYGLVSYDAQSEEMTKGRLGTVMGSGNVNRSEVKDLRKNLEDKAGELLKLEETLKAMITEMSLLQTEYDAQKKFYNIDMTYVNWVSKPFPAERKSSPIRWLIVAISTLAAFFLSLVVIMILENYKNWIQPAKPE